MKCANGGSKEPVAFAGKGENTMKYPKLLQRLETLEMVTYFHDDNAEDMYRNIMQIVAHCKTTNQRTRTPNYL